MTGTLTDDDLDTALDDLAALLDRDADATALVSVRGRLRNPGSAEVLEFGEPAARGRRWSRVAPALLVAAVLVAAVVLAAVLWPRTADRAQPLRPAPAVTSSSTTLQSELDLLPRPLPMTADSSVLFETSGRGDAFFGDAFHVDPPQDGDSGSLVLTYAFVCGDPSSSHAPVVDDPTFLVTDNLGSWGGSGGCYPLGTGAAAPGYSSVSPPTVAGRTGIRITVPAPDIVWRLIVSIGPR